MIIGIYISKDTFDIAYLKDDKWHRKSLNQNENEYKQFCKNTPKENTTILMEATGPYFLKLADYLETNGYKVTVINPKTIHHYGKMRLNRIKTDRKDAELIARYGMDYENELKAWKNADADIISMRQIRRLINLLKNKKTMTSNHLGSLKHQTIQDKLVLKCLEQEIQSLTNHIEKLESKIEAMVKSKWPKEYSQLLTISGIGEITAMTLLIMTEGFTRFNNVKEFLSYIGMAPKPHQSGTSIKGKGGISKMGNGYIRQILYMCAWTAKNNNLACKNLYQRLKAKGKPEKVIKIAIAHKRLRQAFAMIYKGSDYNSAMA